MPCALQQYLPSAYRRDKECRDREENHVHGRERFFGPTE